MQQATLRSLLLLAVSSVPSLCNLLERRVLLVSPNEPTSLNCPLDFHGRYHSRRPIEVYIGADSCSNQTSFGDLDAVSFDAYPGERLVWIEEVEAEGELREQELNFSTSLDSLVSQKAFEVPQVVLSSPQRPRIRLLWSGNDAAILAVPDSALGTLDYYLPRLFEAVAIPSSPLPRQFEKDERLLKTLANLKFNPDVASILSSLSLARMQFDVRYLTGESTDSPIVSRHSFASGSRLASAWIKSRLQDLGTKCSYMEFLPGFAPNVVCDYPIVPDAPTVILGAHYDSRGSFGSTRAPGGDDDGSGTTQLLAIAHSIQKKKISFDINVQIVAFAGEEQGLLGSAYYAGALRANNSDVLLMIQSDMLAYHSADEPIQLGLPESIGNPLASQLVANISSIYVPELTVGTTSACCSDHQSFHLNGYTATAMFERAGAIIDPYYHNSGDLSDRPNYDFTQLHAIAKVTLATLLHTAGFTIDSDV